MKFFQACLNNRIIIYILFIAACLVGVFSIYTAKITPMPSMSANDYFVTFSYSGANAETMQKQVIDQVSNWSRIALLDGKDGWVKTVDFEVIK